MKATQLSQTLVKRENNSLKIKGMQMHGNKKIYSEVVLSQHIYFSCFKKTNTGKT
jgi:hypothetical protein